MSTVPNPPSVVERLQSVVFMGRELISRTSLTREGSGLWIMRARATVGALYGKDAPAVDFWCPKWDVDALGIEPIRRVSARLPALERLLSTLSVSGVNNKIFIGHGRSAEWLKLRIFLSQRLELLCDEFNIESTAGLQTGARIETMLNSAQMAFLVLTPEDRHADGSYHARENVIHEVGLFQAKLGYEKAIVLLEQGCSRFSNLDGLTTIDFPPGDLMARSEEIRLVLQREQVL